MQHKSNYFKNTGGPTPMLTIKIFVKKEDSLDVTEVIKKARSFTFVTSQLTDSTNDAFTAHSVDDRNYLQFKISDKEVRFFAVGFNNK